jgi:hypothetical protein
VDERLPSSAPPILRDAHQPLREVGGGEGGDGLGGEEGQGDRSVARTGPAKKEREFKAIDVYFILLIHSFILFI